jgi:hypothetical protein
MVVFGLLFDPEDGGRTALRNVGKLLQGYAASVKQKSVDLMGTFASEFLDV